MVRGLILSLVSSGVWPGTYPPLCQVVCGLVLPRAALAAPLNGPQAPTSVTGHEQALGPPPQAKATAQASPLLAFPPHPCPMQSLASAQFCFAPPGCGWGSRVKWAISFGCIPVIIGDGEGGGA